MMMNPTHLQHIACSIRQPRDDMSHLRNRFGLPGEVSKVGVIADRIAPVAVDDLAGVSVEDD